MAPRPKVPFALHPALQLRSNTNIADGSAAVLSPDGATAAVIRGEYGQSCLELHTMATGAVEIALPPQSAHSIEHLVWSRDGRRWAVGSSASMATTARASSSWASVAAPMRSP